MSKKKKTSTAPSHPSLVTLKPVSPKKPKTKSKKPKNPNPQNPPAPPPTFYSTSITLQKTTFKHSTTIATTTPLIDKNKQISLLFCISTVTDDDSTIFNWCKIDINSDIALRSKPKSKPKPEPKACPVICSMPNSVPVKFRSVQTLDDSKVYALGGIDGSIDGPNPSCKVFVCDFNDANSSWEEIAPMQSPRVCPALAVSFDGKVYALGSFESQLEGPWGEFFDPDSNSWTQLPPPPTHETLSDCVFVRDRNELVYFSNASDSAYSFDLQDWSYKCINVNGKEASYGLGKTVAIGNVVYTFQKRNLYAFDLSMENPSLEPVYGLEKATAFLGEDDSVFLAYIGFGRMCLVSAGQKDDGLLKITCERFTVGTYVQKNRFHAIAVLDSSEEFVAEGSELHDCLAVATPGEELRYRPSYKDRDHDDDDYWCP